MRAVLLALGAGDGGAGTFFSCGEDGVELRNVTDSGVRRARTGLGLQVDRNADAGRVLTTNARLAVRDAFAANERLG